LLFSSIFVHAVSGQEKIKRGGTTLTWIGGGDNSPSDPDDWSPAGAYNLGTSASDDDTLIMNAGTMDIDNVNSFALSDSHGTLTIGGDVTFNITDTSGYSLGSFALRHQDGRDIQSVGWWA